MADRVLMTADTIGGVWTYSLELARGLGYLGYHVVLATMGAPLRPEQRRDADRISNLTVVESNFKLEWMDDPWEDVTRAGDWLLDLECCVNPSVIHLNAYAHGVLGWSVPVLVVGHSCVLSWWRAVHGGDAPASWDRYRKLSGEGLRSADLVVAPSRAMLASLEQHYGPLGPSLVAPNGVDPTQFVSADKRGFILTVGRLWDAAKNAAALEAVAPRVAWPIYAAGEEQHPGSGAARLESVHCLGRLEPSTLRCWMAAASIYALPARYEPFGLSALEAAFSGCALVLGDIPSLREIWDDAAVFVPPDDPEALRSCLERLIDDPVYRYELAARAQARASDFTARRMAASYAAAYRSLQRRTAARLV